MRSSSTSTKQIPAPRSLSNAGANLLEALTFASFAGLFLRVRGNYAREARRSKRVGAADLLRHCNDGGFPQLREEPRLGPVHT
jgi:hypothetical protein